VLWRDTLKRDWMEASQEMEVGLAQEREGGMGITIVLYHTHTAHTGGDR
jgi:hypothetical protein